jgi:hypothetical protein
MAEPSNVVGETIVQKDVKIRAAQANETIQSTSSPPLQTTVPTSSLPVMITTEGSTEVGISSSTEEDDGVVIQEKSRRMFWWF